jgi:hypothetical protein
MIGDEPVSSSHRGTSSWVNTFVLAEVAQIKTIRLASSQISRGSWAAGTSKRFIGTGSDAKRHAASDVLWRHFSRLSPHRIDRTGARKWLA